MTPSSWLSPVGTPCVQRLGLRRGERVKDTSLKWGRVPTSDLLKYSWGFLHFNLLLLKRWLCFPVWQPLGKADLLLPGGAEPRAEPGASPRAPRPARKPRAPAPPASPPFITLPEKERGARASGENGVRRWALFGLGNALSFGGFVFLKFCLFYH